MTLLSRRPVRAALLGFLLAAAGFLLGVAAIGNAAAAPAAETVSLAPGTSVHLATPPFILAGKRYAFTWPGGGPPNTYTIKSVRADGWVEVQVAEDNVDPAFLVPGQTPSRWLHVGLAVSIQEMRPLPY